MNKIMILISLQNIKKPQKHAITAPLEIVAYRAATGFGAPGIHRVPHVKGTSRQFKAYSYEHHAETRRYQRRGII